MIRRIASVTVALALGLLSQPALGAFKDIDVSPRARAMGDAAVAVADDAFAPVLNPAGMALMTGPTLGNSYVQPFSLSFSKQLYLGGVVPINEHAGTLGFGFRRFKTEYQGVELQGESTFTLAHAAKLYEDMHSTVCLGWALNIYNLKFGETMGGPNTGSGIDPGSDTVAGVDAGLLVILHTRTRLGVRVHNMNNPQIGLDNEELPQTLTGGVAYEPYDGVTTVFEIGNTIEGETQYHGGIEFSVLGQLELRGGVVTNPNKLTAGFGYLYQGMGVNYGFSTGGGVLPPSHQFGLTFAWGGEAP